MHSHDRTMIAKLGFADPDKGNREHELACQFLVQPDVAARLSSAVVPDDREYGHTDRAKVQHLCHPTERDFRRHRDHVAYVKQEKARGNPVYGLDRDMEPPKPVMRDVEVERELSYRFAGSPFLEGLTEVPINKGEGQYRTTVGFLDVGLQFEHEYELVRIGDASGRCHCCEERLNPDWPGEAPRPKRHGRRWRAVVEVKIGRVPVSDAIRQMMLYRTYLQAEAWMLATPWPLDAHEMKCLNDQGIKHILLGGRFEEFCEAAESLPDAESALTL